MRIKKYIAAIILAASISTSLITAQAKKENVYKKISVENSKTTKNRKNAKNKKNVKNRKNKKNSKNKKSKIKDLDTSSKNSGVSSIKNLDLSSLNVKVGKGLKQFKINYDFDKINDDIFSSDSDSFFKDDYLDDNNFDDDSVDIFGRKKKNDIFDKVADTDLNRCLGFFWYMNKLYEKNDIDLNILKQLKMSIFNLLSSNFHAFDSSKSATVCLKDEEIKNLKNTLKKQDMDKLIFSESSFKETKHMVEKLLKEDIEEANKMIKINEKAIKILNGEESKKEKIKKVEKYVKKNLNEIFENNKNNIKITEQIIKYIVKNNFSTKKKCKNNIKNFKNMINNAESKIKKVNSADYKEVKNLMKKFQIKI